MEKFNVRSLVISAILAALVIVTITTVNIPITYGYLHFADSFILIGGLLGPFYGFLIGGVSTFLSDALLGYMVYAPWSFIIHGVQGLLMSLYISKITNMNWMKFFVGGLIISIITVVFGYAFAEYFISGSKMVAALNTIPANLLQVCAGSALGALLFTPVKKLIEMKKQQNS